MKSPAFIPKWITRKRVVLGAGILVGVFGLWLAAHLGWFSPQLTWQQATGWDKIPLQDRPSTARPPPGSPLIRWLGHAGFYINWHGVTIAVDPDLSPRCTIAPRRFPAPLQPAELGPLDLVLISHAHFDHLDVPTLEGIPSIGMLIIPTGGAVYLPKDLPVASISELAIGEQTQVGELTITAVYAQHNGNRGHPFKGKALAAGYILQGAETTLYISGDTGYHEGFRKIGETYRPNLAILPIGAFAPRIPLEYYHLNPEEAVQAAKDLGSPFVIPCHFGTFVLSLDKTDEALPRFAAAARENQVNWGMPELLTALPLTSSTLIDISEVHP